MNSSVISSAPETRRRNQGREGMVAKLIVQEAIRKLPYASDQTSALTVSVEGKLVIITGEVSQECRRIVCSFSSQIFGRYPVDKKVLGEGWGIHTEGVRSISTGK